jgi:hypothetical protein
MSTGNVPTEFGASSSLGSVQHVRTKQQLSRLLYSNAVCMLSTGDH